MSSSAAEYFRKLSPLKGESNTHGNDSRRGKYGRCHCCPYGYHIDLDFVRYCQALNQGAKNDNPALIELKRMKKARRRQTKSMEAMLGIANQEEDKSRFKEHHSFNSYSEHQQTKFLLSHDHGSHSPVPPPREKRRLFTPPSPPPRKQSLTHPALRSPPPPDIINSSSLLLNRRNEVASDALQEAMLDFEETLESSNQHSKRKSRLDNYQPYNTIDLLHHTTMAPQAPHATLFSSRLQKPSVATVGRSNSLPRQFFQESSTFSRQPYYSQKEPASMTQSYTLYNGYSSQSPLICDAMTALNAAQGNSAYRSQDFDTMSVTSAMSGVSTTTLQSIRDQMATGLSRLRELEEDVKGIPMMQTKMDILKEEKRILLEQLHCLHRGIEPPPAPISLERDYWADANSEDLDTRLDTLRRFSVDDRRRSERKRSLSPMRVNLQDFHSYRRARRGSLSEGSDTESVHSYRGREKSGERDNTRLYISESNDQTLSERISPSKRSATSYSLPGTPMISRRGVKDAAVSCRVLTRDIGVSHVPPRSRSVGTSTDKIDDFVSKDEKKKEVKAKPCLQCFRRNQKTFESRSVGTSVSPPKRSSEEVGVHFEELHLKLNEQDFNAKNTLLQKLGKKSPIISRLSSPQLFPPTLTFDNSTNTEPLNQRDQRLNTSLRMDDLFSREQLNELIEDARRQWEVTHRSRISPLKESRKPLTSDRGVQTTLETTFKPLMQHVSVTAKPSTRDTGVGFISIDHVEPKAPSRPKTRNVACGVDTSFLTVTEAVAKKVRSVGVGDSKLTDIICTECAKRKKSSIHHVRSVACGDGRISDLLCDKCSHLSVRSIGVGDARVSDDTCKKCKLKRTSSSACQVQPSSRSVSVEANLPAPLPPPKEPSSASTPEVERRPFGSSGVRICDKCHEAITSVAKDIVSITGPSPTTAAVVSQVSSKIPRLVDHQKPEQKSPPKPVAEIPPPTAVSSLKIPPLDLPLKERAKTPEFQGPSTTSTLAMTSDKTALRVEEKALPKTPTQTETFSSSSSIVSSSIPSLGASPQVKRVPYHRQDTYTKQLGGGGVAGFVNPAFEEAAQSKLTEPLPSKEKGKISPVKETADKIGKTPRKFVSKEELKPKESEAVIKGKEEAKSSASSSSSSSSSDDEDEVSVVGSSVPADEALSLRTSTDTVGRPRKKAQPSRGMRAALKVLNDSIGKPVRSGQQLNNAINIIQKEWFKISSQKDADPHAVEEYMDAFEEYSKGLLQRVVNLSDTNGNTAMHYAVCLGNFDVVSVLLNSKVCNINYQNKAGYTAIMLVALAQIRNDAHESVVKKLFESGDVNIKASQHGQTGLMLAVSHGRMDMVKMLIAAGANPNIQDDDGSTALMCAAEHGHLAIVRYLVAQPDTDLYLMDNDGSTALTIAVEAGHKDVGVLLYKQMNLARGSSPYSYVRGGKRPRTPTLIRSSITPPPRASAPSSPGRSRKSSGRVSPAHARQSSASLSNLIL